MSMSVLSWLEKVGGEIPGESWTPFVKAAVWSAAMVLFSFVVLAYDTRPVKQFGVFGMPLRDRIIGLEQRYFVVVLNGILLLGTLLYAFQRDDGSQIYID